MIKQMIHIVVGVITRDNDVLIAKRPHYKDQGGLWEFPGGKIERGESEQAALRRELLEELEIEITRSRPWMQIEHEYEDKKVLLNVYHCDQFSGTPIGAEGQEVIWATISDLDLYPFPAANEAIIKKLKLSWIS